MDKSGRVSPIITTKYSDENIYIHLNNNLLLSGLHTTHCNFTLGKYKQTHSVAGIGNICIEIKVINNNISQFLLLHVAKCLKS